ncbi:hypothetical protein PI125_g5026 [Phytophthora idaei]|nr:hypothetical protein PI125_g5026 [Phytophthora idaei]KAG3164673.1 hypothetical protein PI126_g5018 [Phytophthora idaei]
MATDRKSYNLAVQAGGAEEVPVTLKGSLGSIKMNSEHYKSPSEKDSNDLVKVRNGLVKIPKVMMKNQTGW